MTLADLSLDQHEDGASLTSSYDVAHYASENPHFYASLHPQLHSFSSGDEQLRIPSPTLVPEGK